MKNPWQCFNSDNGQELTENAANVKEGYFLEYHYREIQILQYLAQIYITRNIT